MNNACTSTELENRRPGLRIALVTETYPPEINGVAMTLQRMVQGLLARGHRVQLIRPRQGAEDAPAATPEFVELLTRGCALPKYDGLRFGLPAGANLRLEWKSIRPDLVHVATEGPLGWSAVSSARRLGIPVTSDFHTNFDHYSKHYGLGLLRHPVTAYLRRFHNRSARTFVPTAEIAADLEARGYKRLSVVARGVDTALYAPSRRQASLRASWGVDDGAPVVLYVGRLAAEKNLPLVVRSFAKIAERVPAARMVFVGDGPMREELRRLMPQAIFAGMRTGVDLAEHYASADVFVFPSLTETFGNVTLEALASGLAVVACRMAAAAEVIIEGDNGLAAAPGDERGFIERAVRVAADRDLRARFGVRARESACGLDWEAVNDRFAAELLGVWEANVEATATGRPAASRSGI
jgi:glycosyltransferase involved in cell wall biosynthesis